MTIFLYALSAIEITTMLEIKVNDACYVYDTLEEAVEFVMPIIKCWYEADEKAPLAITLTKIESRAGPALSISVGEKLPTKDGLR